MSLEGCNNKHPRATALPESPTKQGSPQKKFKTEPSSDSPISKFASFISPLSKDESKKRKSTDLEGKQLQRNPARKKLFVEKPKDSIDEKELSQIYKIDFSNPPSFGIVEHFFQLRDQLLLIENFLLKHAHSIDVHRVRVIIYPYLDPKYSHEEKMTELGALFYYLERDLKVPEVDFTFITHRSQEMLREIETLKTNYNENCPEKISEIPLGTMHYILRAFARMLITSNQQLNIGAVYCVRSILNLPQACIIPHLVPEHREHILTILTNILLQPQLKTLLEKKVHVHPEMADLIRIDLKLSQNEKVESAHVLWACLIALFFDIRQDNIPNCYAISCLIYATQNGTYKVLSKLIDWLTTGYFSVSSSMAIPISLLVENRLIFEKDLGVKLRAEDALSLTAVSKICQMFGIENEQSAHTTQEIDTLQATLKKVLEENNLQESLPFAEKLFYFFRRNALLTMMQAVIEFQTTNMDNQEGFSASCSESKKELIDHLMSSISVGFNYQFCKIMKEKIQQKIWLENHFEEHVKVDKDKVIVGPSRSCRTISNFKGDLQALANSIKVRRRIFFLEGSNFIAIETISDLQEKLKVIGYETAKELFYAKKEYIFIDNFFAHKNYASAIALYCTNQIKNPKILASDLLEANLLLFYQDGDYPHYALKQLFQLNYKTKIIVSNNARHFLEELYTFLNTSAASTLLNAPIILTGSKTHAFCMNTSKGLSLLAGASDFDAFLDNLFYRPAQAFLNQPISPELMANGIDLCAKDDLNLKNRLKTLIKNKKGMTYSEFRDLLIQERGKTTGSRVKTKRILDELFAKVKIDFSEWKLIIEKVISNIEAKELAALEKDLSKEFDGKSVYPYQIAHALHNLLIDKDYLKDPFEIERAICKVKNLPVAFDLGDLMWGDQDADASFHCRLIIRFDFGNNYLRYFTRRKESEKAESKEEYSQLEIYYP